MIFVFVASGVLVALFNMAHLPLLAWILKQSFSFLTAVGDKTVQTCIITADCCIYNTIFCSKWSFYKVTKPSEARRTKFTQIQVITIVLLLPELPCLYLLYTPAPVFPPVIFVGNSMAAVTWAVHIHIYTHIVRKMDACIALTSYLNCSTAQTAWRQSNSNHFLRLQLGKF